MLLVDLMFCTRGPSGLERRRACTQAVSAALANKTVAVNWLNLTRDALSAFAKSADVQVASVAPLAASTQQKAADPLRADPRWPKLKNCIDNTTTQDEFQACLQMAFMDVAPTGKVLALLTR